MRHGLEAAARQFPLASAGIDSWGVDYGLLDESGALLGNPVHYRDARTDGVPRGCRGGARGRALRRHRDPAPAVQHDLPARRDAHAPARRDHAADSGPAGVLAHRQAGAEITNASTTSLFDVRAQAWATGLIEKAGLPPRIFPPLRRPGEVIGPVIGPNGLGSPLPVIAVGSHDTASAVAAVPAAGPDFAYISSGTWSLAGMELDAPVLTEASRAANFTNETGIDGTIRYLRNVTGLWLLQESLRSWPGASLGRPAGRGGAAPAAAVRDRPGRPGVPAAG